MSKYVTYKLFKIKDINKRRFLYQAFEILKEKDNSIICVNTPSTFGACYYRDNWVWRYLTDSNAFLFDGVSYYLDDTVGYDYLLSLINDFDLEEFKKDIVIKPKEKKTRIPKKDNSVKTTTNEVIPQNKESIPNIDPYFDEQLYEALKVLRKELLPKAYKVRVKLYIKNETLQKMAFYKPKTKYEFCSIDGLTPSIYKAFGEKFIELIKEFENNK